MSQVIDFPAVMPLSSAPASPAPAVVRKPEPEVAEEPVTELLWSEEDERIRAAAKAFLESSHADDRDP